MDANSPAGNEALWTALDVARYLRLSRSTVYNLVNRGAIAIRIGVLIAFLRNP